MGIDIGTSGCKAVVFDDKGNQISFARREYGIISKRQGWAELDTDEVIEKCFQVIGESAFQVRPHPVTGIGISSQGEAFTIIDKDGHALCNAFVSSDIRAKEVVSGWVDNFGCDKLYHSTGHTPHPMFSLFKLLWVKENMPDIWQRAHRILCFEELMQYRLGIEDPAISWSLAGRTMLFDVLNHRWDNDILNSLGIKKEQLARPLQSGQVTGYVKKEIAEKLGLSLQPFVVTGGHDQPCSALGAGIVREGLAAYATGTVECITPAFNKPVFHKKLKGGNLCTYDHAVEGMYTTVAFSLTGGNILRWFKDEFGQNENQKAINRNIDPYAFLLEQMPETPTRLLVLPYFAPTGTPYFDPVAKGVIIGLDLATSRFEIMKALLEGVACEMRLNLEILEESGCRVNELRVTGGGSNSTTWNQLKADITGKPVTVLHITEAGCMGAAMLAKAAHTKINVAIIADEWVKPVTKLYPEKKKEYDQKYTLYKKLYPMLKNTFF